MSQDDRVWSLYSAEDGGQYDGLTDAEARAIVMVLSPEVRPSWHAFRAGWKNWKPLKSCSELMTLGSMSRTKISYRAPEFGEPAPVESESVKKKMPEDPWTVAKDRPQELTALSIVATKALPDLDSEVSVVQETRTDMDEVSLVYESESTASAFDMEHETALHESLGSLEQEDGESSEPENVAGEEATSENRRNKRYKIKLHAEIICQNKVYETFTRDVSLGGVAVQGCLPTWVAGYGTLVLSTLDMKYRLEFMCSVVENQRGRNFRLELYPSTDSHELRRWLEGNLPLDVAK